MNNMTGDPNQETRPSIFGFETYPPQVAQPIDWSRIPLQQPPLPLIPQTQFSPLVNYQQPQVDLGNFSFCATETPHPAQFPFPVGAPRAGVSDGFGFNPVSSLRCKRKTDSPPPVQAYKQHITEEKMAEHMSRLHINSETASSSKESTTERTQRLYMCEEMRKLQSDSILPHSLLSKIQRPCTALVLWTPPQRIIQLDDSNNANNNEENIPDSNLMENEPAILMDPNSTMDLDNA